MSSNSNTRPPSPSSPQLEMGFKPFGMDFQSSASWHHRRLQRIAIFVALSLIVIGAGLYRHKIYPTGSEFPLDSIYGIHKDTPTPDPLEPKLPFIKDEDRKKAEEASLAIPDVTYEVPKKAIDSSLTALDHTRVALLIETRALPHIPALLLHFISVIPLAWTVRFMGTPRALEPVKASRALQMYIETGKLLLIDLPANLPVTTQQGLSEVFTSLTFYKETLAPAEWLLVFQSDSILCAASELSLDDWVDMGYAYVGAPWGPGIYGGNGGLSLRHVPSIIDILTDPNITQRIPGEDRFEDRWICDNLKEKFNASMPSAEIQSHFSVESLWNEKPMGYHLRGGGLYKDLEIWGDLQKKRKIFSYCPEVKIILEDMDFRRRRRSFSFLS